MTGGFLIFDNLSGVWSDENQVPEPPPSACLFFISRWLKQQWFPKTGLNKMKRVHFSHFYQPFLQKNLFRKKEFDISNLN
jgi:hypothetical protein